jgi:hypothetical protein
MTTPEHQIKQGASGAVIEDTFSIDPAQNIVGASAQFVFRSPEGESNTVRSASFETEGAAATSITFSRVMGADANNDAGVYIYEWKLTLSSGDTLIFPESGATDDFPERKTYTFEILEALSPADEPSDEPVPTRLMEWAMGEDYTLSNIEYSSGGAIETADVLWPDGSAGVFTTTDTDDNDPSLIDAYTITHTDSGKTVTQAAVTRDDEGRVVTQPALTIA